MSKSKPVVLLLTILLLTSCLLLSSTTEKATATARTITVPDDFSTIKEAVDNANAGDTVFVKAGTYRLEENPCYTYMVYVGLSIDKPISLIGENSQTTVIITSEYLQLVSNTGIAVKADNVTISGFTIISNGSITSTIMSLSGRNTVLTNCSINSIGTPLSTVAVRVRNGAQVYSNTIEGSGLGYGVSAGNNSFISNNLICNFEVGLTNYSSDFNQSIVDNTIANNSIGVEGLTVPALFSGNNILNCSQYSLTLGSSGNVTATLNYWGTNTQSAIEASIYDNNDDPSLGTVNFTPFLTELNSQAMPNQNSSEPIDYLSIAVIAIVIVLLVIGFIVIYKRYPRKV